MKFTLLDANGKELHTVETLAIADALAYFKKQLGYSDNWNIVSSAWEYHEVKIKDERNNYFYYILPPKDKS